MDHIGILKNAFQTTIRYRALWVLGILWALVGGGTSNSFPNPGNSSSNVNYNMGPDEFGGWDFDPGLIIGTIILACCIGLFLLIIATIIRYTLQAGVYRSLAKLELQGETPTVSGGFREGWNRRTWRLFFQNLLIAIPFVIISLLLLALAAAPLLLLITENEAAIVVGVIAAIGLFLIWMGAMIIAGTIISVLQQLWWRAAVVGDLGVIDAIKSAWHLLRANLGDIAIMWLLMFGIGILMFVVMIPLMLILLVFTGVGAGFPGYMIYQATESFLLAGLWAVPIGLVFFVLPLLIVSGLYLIFQASVWNQVYNQVAPRTGLDPA